MTIVVAVLITNCQVSEKWKRGPAAAQTASVTQANRKAHGEPAAMEMEWAQSLNRSLRRPLGEPFFEPFDPDVFAFVLI